MENKKINLLKSLLDIPSPSGFENNLANYIRKILLNYLPKSKVKVDFQNNVIVTINGTQPDKVVMIDAHIDEIGFILTNVDKDNMITMKYIGGGDNSILSARNLNILTDKGKINAVINRKHAHLVNDEEEEAIVNIHEANIDIGLRNRKEILRTVKIGDPIVYNSDFKELLGKCYSGYGFDDKSGCFILIETIKQIIKSKIKPVPTLIFTFSAQEETGYTKIKPLVRKYKPQLFIELDVTFASDYPEVDEREVGKCELGKGLVLFRGVNSNREALKLIEQVARGNKIKFQYQASDGQEGYISTVITDEGTGVKCLTLGIPLRNMHTPTEIINLKDLNMGTQLLTKFLLNRNIKKVIE